MTEFTELQQRMRAIMRDKTSGCCQQFRAASILYIAIVLVMITVARIAASV